MKAIKNNFVHLAAVSYHAINGSVYERVTALICNIRIFNVFVTIIGRN
ncbi:MAG TPA: hypothetical protein VHO03_01250 [Ignavibacteriales bacterium]|nr:hypothetical protein [Ignavibacteriales bacterium]